MNQDGYRRATRLCIIWLLPLSLGVHALYVWKAPSPPPVPALRAERQSREAAMRETCLADGKAPVFDPATDAFFCGDLATPAGTATSPNIPLSLQGTLQLQSTHEGELGTPVPRSWSDLLIPHPPSGTCLRVMPSITLEVVTSCGCAQENP